jgi:hypothetical protein
MPKVCLENVETSRANKTATEAHHSNINNENNGSVADALRLRTGTVFGIPACCDAEGPLLGQGDSGSLVASTHLLALECAPLTDASTGSASEEEVVPPLPWCGR